MCGRPRPQSHPQHQPHPTPYTNSYNELGDFQRSVTHALARVPTLLSLNLAGNLLVSTPQARGGWLFYMYMLMMPFLHHPRLMHAHIHTYINMTPSL